MIRIKLVIKICTLCHNKDNLFLWHTSCHSHFTKDINLFHYQTINIKIKSAFGKHSHYWIRGLLKSWIFTWRSRQASERYDRRRWINISLKVDIRRDKLQKYAYYISTSYSFYWKKRVRAGLWIKVCKLWAKRMKSSSILLMMHYIGFPWREDVILTFRLIKFGGKSV